MINVKKDLNIYKREVDSRLSSNKSYDAKEKEAVLSELAIQEVIREFDKQIEKDANANEYYNGALLYVREALNKLRNGDYLKPMKRNRIVRYIYSSIYLLFSFANVYTAGESYYKIENGDAFDSRELHGTAMVLFIIIAAMCIRQSKGMYDDALVFSESIDEYKRILSKKNDPNNTTVNN